MDTHDVSKDIVTRDSRGHDVLFRVPCLSRCTVTTTISSSTPQHHWRLDCTFGGPTIFSHAVHQWCGAGADFNGDLHLLQPIGREPRYHRKSRSRETALDLSSTSRHHFQKVTYTRSLAAQQQ